MASNSPRLDTVRVSGKFQETIGNPSPLGLVGLAMVTFVACSSKLGLTEGTVMIIPWAIFLGALAQVVAGWLDFKHNNTFGATAFFGYGLFWFSMALSWMFTNGMFGQHLVLDMRQMGFAFLGYLIFSLFMTVAAMGTNKVLFIIFCFVDLLLLGLFMSTMGCGEFWHYLAAWSELAIALFSFYGFGANILNNMYGYTVLPLGAPFGPLQRKKAALSK